MILINYKKNILKMSVEISNKLLTFEMNIEKKNKNQFVFKNIDLSLVNAIRRICCSLIPSLAFNNSENNDDTIIHKNTSSLHNELIVNRLALVPLNANGIFKIKTKYDKDASKRECAFVQESIIPNFILHEKNNNYVPIKNFSDSLQKDVTVQDFKLEITNEQKKQFEKAGISSNEIENYVKSQLFHRDSVPDINNLDKKVASDSIIIILKPSLSQNNDIQEIHLHGKPIVGQPVEHSSFSRICTPFIEFMTTTDKVELERLFRNKINSINEIRQQKNKNMITKDSDEWMKQKSIFECIDRQKMFKQNSKGEPNEIMLTVESINSFTPQQHIFDSIIWLKLMLNDLYFEFNRFQKSKIIEINEHETIKNAIDVKLTNHNHTIGNILNTFGQKLFIDNLEIPILGNSLQFMSYRAPHPLYEEIVITMQFTPEANMTEVHNEIISKLRRNYDKKRIEHHDFEDENYRLSYILLIKFLIQFILEKYITPLEQKFSKLTSIQEPTFTVID